MFKIGDFSKLCRVPTSMLRYYDDLDLLKPAHIDKFTSYRYYTFDQLPRLNRILALKDLGLSLEQIKQVLDEALSPEELRGMLRLKQAEIQQQIEEEQARLARVAARLKHIEQEGRMPTQEVILKSIDAQHVLSIREIVATPPSVGTLLMECFSALSAHGIPLVGAPNAIFYDEEYKPTNLDTEIALPVTVALKQDLPLKDGRALVIRELPAIPSAACIIHNRGFDTIHESYLTVAQWIEANGYRITGPSREVYLRPSDEQGNTLTEIQFQIDTK